jgi:hypothetical protein
MFWRRKQERGKPMDKKSRARMYGEFLKSQGYAPEVDSDGDVRFKKEGRTYFVAIDEDDEEFFRVIFPNFWKIESEDERRRVLVACDHSNSLSKVAKVYMVEDNVWASIELFFGDPEDFKSVFERSMGALQNGVANFVQKMRE